MLEIDKENNSKNTNLLDLSLDDKQNLVAFFGLLVKVDKRINQNELNNQ